MIEKYKDELGDYYFFFLANLYNNIGIIYENQGNYDSALVFYSSGLSASWKTKDSTSIGNLYSNLGKMYEVQGNYPLALSNHKEGLRIRAASSDNYGLARSYGHLGQAFLNLTMYDSALYYAEKGLSKAEEIGTPETALYNKMVLAQILKKLGRPDEAFDEYVEYHELYDSLTKVNNSKELAQIELQYEKERIKREAEIERREREFWMIGIIGALVFISSLTILLFFLQRSRSRKNELIKDNALLENKQLELEKNNLEADLEFKNKELTTNVMYLMKKNELLNEISQRLLDIKKGLKLEGSKAKVQKIIVELNSASADDVWEEFELRFNAVYNDFYDRLTDQFPDLTKNDRNLCAFLRLNMSTKEICAITRQSVKSLNVSRSRLRKKLGITNAETSIMAFLESI